MSRASGERFLLAAKDGYLDVLKEASKKDLNTGDEDGMTSVTWAAHNGHLDALRLIIGRGGDVDKSDCLGLTPLHHAASRGLLPTVTYLVNWGANVFALDNDHHSALDLASLQEKVEVVQYLDAVYATQQTKNPRHVARLKEEALRQAERNVRRYEKLQDEAARRAEKQQRKISTNVGPIVPVGEKDGASRERKHSLFKTLTLTLRGSKGGKAGGPGGGKTYSDIAGLSKTGGVAKRINQRRHTDGFAGGLAPGPQADFRVSDVDESGRRTLRSISATHGVRSNTSDVMYLTGQHDAQHEVSGGRLAVYDVFSGAPGGRGLAKSKSEPDLLDSGVDSYLGDDDEDEENAPGIFNRPGFGKTAFFTTTSFLNTLPSFHGDDVQDGGNPSVSPASPSQSRVTANGLPHNGHDSEEARRNGGLVKDDDFDAEDVLGTGAAWAGPRELPWGEEEVDPLDDDEDTSATPGLEMLLWSAGLEAYLHKFLQEKVDMDVLVGMSDADLKEIGLPFGPRRKLLDALKRRNDVLAKPKRMVDSFL